MSSARASTSNDGGIAAQMNREQSLQTLAKRIEDVKRTSDTTKRKLKELQESVGTAASAATLHASLISKASVADVKRGFADIKAEVDNLRASLPSKSDLESILRQKADVSTVLDAMDHLAGAISKATGGKLDLRRYMKLQRKHSIDAQEQSLHEFIMKLQKLSEDRIRRAERDAMTLKATLVAQQETNKTFREDLKAALNGIVMFLSAPDEVDRGQVVARCQGLLSGLEDDRYVAGTLTAHDMDIGDAQAFFEVPRRFSSCDTEGTEGDRGSSPVGATGSAKPSGAGGTVKTKATSSRNLQESVSQGDLCSLDPSNNSSPAGDMEFLNPFSAADADDDKLEAVMKGLATLRRRIENLEEGQLDYPPREPVAAEASNEIESKQISSHGGIRPPKLGQPHHEIGSKQTNSRGMERFTLVRLDTIEKNLHALAEEKSEMNTAAKQLGLDLNLVDSRLETLASQVVLVLEEEAKRIKWDEDQMKQLRERCDQQDKKISGFQLQSAKQHAALKNQLNEKIRLLVKRAGMGGDLGNTVADVADEADFSTTVGATGGYASFAQHGDATRWDDGAAAAQRKAEPTRENRAATTSDSGAGARWNDEAVATSGHNAAVVRLDHSRAPFTAPASNPPPSSPHAQKHAAQPQRPLTRPRTNQARTPNRQVVQYKRNDVNSRLTRLQNELNCLKAPLEEQALGMKQELEAMVYELRRQQHLYRDMLSEYTVVIHDCYSLQQTTRDDVNRLRNDLVATTEQLQRLSRTSKTDVLIDTPYVQTSGRKTSSARHNERAESFEPLATPLASRGSSRQQRAASRQATVPTAKDVVEKLRSKYNILRAQSRQCSRNGARASSRTPDVENMQPIAMHDFEFGDRDPGQKAPSRQGATLLGACGQSNWTPFETQPSPAERPLSGLIDDNPRDHAPPKAR